MSGDDKDEIMKDTKESVLNPMCPNENSSRTKRHYYIGMKMLRASETQHVH